MYESNKKKYTVRDYEQLPEGAAYQLIDGELINMTPSPTFYHQNILLNITIEFSNYLKKNNQGKIVFSPIDVHLTEENVFQPDLVFISKENISIIKERIEGIPDLVLEILSESTAYYDLVKKKRIYESSGVKEYWIVDPIEKNIEVLENVNNNFRLFHKANYGEIVKSQILSTLEINTENIF